MDKEQFTPRSRDHLIVIVFIVAMLTCFMRTTAEAGMPVAGQQAPDLVLPGLLDPSTRSLKDLKGKVVLLNIWASWCTSCKEEMEDLLAVQEQYGSRGFAIVAVSIDNDPSSAITFMKRFEDRTSKRPGFVLLYDKDKTVSREYRQRSMPMSYLIDREGIVRKIYPGSFSKSTIEMLKTEISEALK